MVLFKLRCEKCDFDIVLDKEIAQVGKLAE